MVTKPLSSMVQQIIDIYKNAENVKRQAQNILEQCLSWQELAEIGMTIPAIFSYRKHYNEPSLVVAKKEVEEYIKRYKEKYG